MNCALCHQPINKGDLYLHVSQAGDTPYTEAHTEIPIVAHLHCTKPATPTAIDNTPPELTARERITKQAWQAK